MSYSEFEIVSFETEMETEMTTSTMPLNANPFKSVTIQDFAPNYSAVRVPMLSQYRLTNNVFGFTVLNVDAHSANYVQACTNLSLGNWLTISTNVPATTSFSFTDPQAAGNQRRFYRVMVNP